MKEFNNYDIIGDIHGHSNDLKQLLSALGYKKIQGVYQHPERKALFLGDYIDRGVNVIEVLEIVKKMSDNGHAIALMGNHEFNAICYNTPDENGDYLRKHTPIHFNQHAITMAAFMRDPELYKFYIEWFKTLPLFFENNTFRAVHACWDQEAIDLVKTQLKGHNRIPLDFLREASIKGTPLYDAIEITLKGKEALVPEGKFFKDKDGILRKKFRVKWWEEQTNPTYVSMSVMDLENYLPDTPFDTTDFVFYESNSKPVFFGHYWMKFKTEEKPATLTPNTCCLDYSVASNGHLVCYRYSGEQTLDNKRITYIA